MSFKPFRLDGGGDSVVLALPDGGPPRLVYWGPALPLDEDLQVLADLSADPVPQGGLDDGEPLSWLPEAGRGFMGRPALEAHRDGQLVITQLVAREVRCDGDCAEVDLADAVAGIELLLTLSLDASSGVLSSRVRVTNAGDSALTVDWLAAGALPVSHDEIVSFGGRWAREFMQHRQTLGSGAIVLENRTGRTSHHAPPFMIAGSPGFGESSGAVFAVHLAWSGNHRLAAERLRDGRIQMQAGALHLPGEAVLAPGETLETPILYAARSDAGLNDLSARLHGFVRSAILPREVSASQRPVHFNTWEAAYFAQDEASMMALADATVAIGVERFVLDDGWLRGRNHDRAGLGDWAPDAAKYPRGLKPLADHVRALGMSFGLWVEPEMANADSDLLRAHPDWVLGAPGREQPLGRHQYVLDLTRGEVADHVFALLDARLVESGAAYLKWDMNRDLTHPVSAGRAAVMRQTQAVYRLIDRVRAAHPGVEIESCASGGGRADYEILKRTTRIWTSDCNDPFDRQPIQRAASIFFPPEIMGAHVGPADSHTTARRNSLAFRAFTAMGGHFGVEADLMTMPESDRRALAEMIALHKRLRPHLHGHALLRLDHADAGCLATQQGDGDVWLVAAAQIATPVYALTAPLRVSGLEGSARYRVRLLNPPEAPRASMKKRTALVRGETLEASGLALMTAGLHLPPLRAGEIAAVLIERIETPAEARRA